MRLRPWRLRAAAAGALLVVGLTSCTTVSGMVRTQRALDDAGYADPRVVFVEDDGRGVVVEVGYRTESTDVAALTREYAEAAEIVWKRAPVRFDAVDLSASDAPGECVDPCVDSFGRAGLQASYGARAASLDKDLRDEAARVNVIAIALMLVGLGIGMSVVLLSRRRAKRSRLAHSARGGWPPPLSSRPAPPVAPTPHQPAPGYAPPPPGYTTTPAAPNGRTVPGAPGAPSAPTAWRSADDARDAWPPADPPPMPAPPPPVPTYDIWERLPS